MLEPAPYQIAEVYMFDTCTHKCGYCWLAESGQVLDFAQLEGAVGEIRTANEQSQIQIGESVRIVTAPGRWSYAASFPLSVQDHSNCETWLRVRLKVLQGEIGIGVLDRSETSFQDRPFVSASGEEQTIFVQITNPVNCHSLIIRKRRGRWKSDRDSTQRGESVGRTGNQGREPRGSPCEPNGTRRRQGCRPLRYGLTENIYAEKFLV